MARVAQPFPPELRRSDTAVEPDERAARRDLREQVARLERELQQTLITAFPHGGVDVTLGAMTARPRGPRLLSLGDLERLRDQLADRLAGARADLATRADHEERNRVLLERMLLAPGKHRFVRIANADLGEGGCGVWQVRPRLGIIGMLCGWWHVKLSSGCPLARGRGR
jgi:hypothetical protein